MMAILIDASVLYAYANKSDVHHATAVDIVKAIHNKKYGKVIITDYLFDEVVSVTHRKASKKKAIVVGKTLLDSTIILARINEQVFQKAWKIFQKEEKLSFTDSTSIAFMHTYEIKHIATFDKACKDIKSIRVIDK